MQRNVNLSFSAPALVDEHFPCTFFSFISISPFWSITSYNRIHFHYPNFKFISCLLKDACNSYRSPQELSKKYFGAKCGFDTAVRSFVPRTSPLKFANW